jgi:hypothetical protein
MGGLLWPGKRHAPSPAINKGRGVSIPRFLSGAIGLDRMRQENAGAK